MNFLFVRLEINARVLKRTTQEKGKARFFISKGIDCGFYQGFDPTMYVRLS